MEKPTPITTSGIKFHIHCKGKELAEQAPTPDNKRKVPQAGPLLINQQTKPKRMQPRERDQQLAMASPVSVMVTNSVPRRICSQRTLPASHKVAEREHYQ
ncbi:hypothetical protein NPIL_327661 [Nephila pilipes]|uniref:Uncharacterized protein n=1 Tax=Nephila pilipes TaxID=299642 RepID=A0A8X6UP36_NEPPI|nr:hypothetical protein NPIL_327661 [Nephila pilipes]